MTNKKNKKDDFSIGNKNLEIINKELDNSKSLEDAIKIAPDKLEVKKGGNIIIGSLNLVAEPIKKRHEKHYKNSKFHLIADLILATTVIVLLVVFFMFRSFEPKLDIFIEANSDNQIITAGKTETFEIKYGNNSDEIVRNSSIHINLPEGFILSKTSLENSFNTLTNTFKIGNIEPKTSGTVKISGIITGSIGDRQVISYSLDYTDRGRKINTLGSMVYLIENSILSVKWEAPKVIYRDINFSNKLIIKNSGDIDIDKNIEISFVDSGLEIKRVNNSSVILNNNIITLSGIKRKGVIELELEALTKSKDDSLQSGIIINTGVEGKKLTQQKIQKIFKITVPKFIINLDSQQKIVRDNENIEFRLNYENKENKEIEKVEFYINPSDSAFSIASLKLKNENELLTLKGDKIVAKNNIKKGEKGFVDFIIKFKRKNIKTNQTVGVLVNTSYELDGKKNEYEIISPKVKLFSDLQVSSRGYYYSEKGDQLGVGPIPPAVSISTRYWIFWGFNNLGNRLENFNISAILPENVFWTDEKSLTIGKMRFGQIGKKVVWIVDEINIDEERGRAGFEIELIPTEADKGKIVNLLEDIEFSAYDNFTKKDIKGKLENVDSNLKYDNLAGGKGKVIKMNIIQ